MALTRREFLKTTLAGAVAAVAFTGCIPRSELQIQSPPLMPEDLVEGRDLWYATLNQARPGWRWPYRPSDGWPGKEDRRQPGLSDQCG